MIRTSDDYILRTLHDKSYLIPIGQKIALGCPCIELNESGVLLWNAVSSGIPEDMLGDMLRRHYQTGSAPETDFSKDAGAFLSRLLQIGALTDKRDFTGTPCKYFRIAGLVTAFTGHTPCLDDSLAGFACEKTNAVAQHWILRPLIFTPAFSGKIIINNRKLTLFSCEDYYILMYPENRHLTMSRIAKDGSTAEFYHDHLVTADARTELLYGMRNAFLIMAQNNGFFALHSASVSYGGRAWLFSGRSGTGKSTHTALWHSLYHTEIINGDINLIGMQDGNPMVYGTPWCGTSEIYSPETYRLGGIILLQQAVRNEVRELPEGLSPLLLFQRFISPTWFTWQVDKCLAFADQLQKLVKVCQLMCTPHPDSARVMKSYIDSFLMES